MGEYDSASARPQPQERDAAGGQLQSDYRAVFAHPRAQVVLADIFFDAGLFAENTYAAHPNNQNTAAIGVFEGKRRLALRILGMTLGDTRVMCKALAEAAIASLPPPPAAGARRSITENNGPVQ